MDITCIWPSLGQILTRSLRLWVYKSGKNYPNRLLLA